MPVPVLLIIDLSNTWTEPIEACEFGIKDAQDYYLSQNYCTSLETNLILDPGKREETSTRAIM